VTELVEQFDNSHPPLTPHLTVLAAARLASRRKRGRERDCRLEPAALRHSAAWNEACRSHWDSRLDALEALMSELDTEAP
jgi:DNA-binding transcriptional ArsR family regulator